MNIYTLLFSIIILLFAASPAYATQQPNCQPIYGGAGSCEQNSPVTVNTHVLNPESKVYVDNLLPTDPQYKGDDTILFKITVNNPENAAINNIEIYDYLPQFIEYTKGEGKYDKAKRTLTITLGQLKSKETKVYFVEGKVINNDKLPNNQQSRCVINQVLVNAVNKSSQDNALICLAKNNTASAIIKNDQTSKGGLPIYPSTKSTSTPQTGPEIWALLSIILFTGFGFALRSKAKT